ncbi:hypothetical protein [Psychromonas ossibalaenae]|uniref:hypothetical protein n=1 Tax=Psychromonas ossibalaenae TaxID=444922 RepID=UPI000360C4B1|nr:hypothetical protein [Psychromonas ossibalaenae]
MLDAICTYDLDNPKTYSIFEFKVLPETEIDKLRYSLLCPVCKQKAYFRKASRDGKQACFGSRYHQTDCEEFNPSASKSEEEKQIAEVEQIVLEQDSLVIDFSKPVISRKKPPETEAVEEVEAQKKQPAVLESRLSKAVQSPKSNNAKLNSAGLDEENIPPKAARQGLAKLLTSLLRGSSLASSDLWIYTSDKHKWRAKNLFVNIKDAQPTENNAPRMYWGTISHADKTLNWLNPAEDRCVGLPVSKYREQLLSCFDIEDPADVEGAGFILFGKCVLSKDKKRKYIHLWGNDLQYFYLSKVREGR